ncbi:Uncharacterised protein [uncultured archaeon]|nr:Uncharacterised protein [uncultured archaeon]
MEERFRYKIVGNYQSRDYMISSEKALEDLYKSELRLKFNGCKSFYFGRQDKIFIIAPLIPNSSIEWKLTEEEISDKSKTILENSDERYKIFDFLLEKEDYSTRYRLYEFPGLITGDRDGLEVLTVKEYKEQIIPKYLG